MLLTFERRRIGPNPLHGVIVSESKSLILIQYWYDFFFDGYMVIRRRDITEQFGTDSNEFCMRVMKREKLWKPPSKTVRSLPVDDWRTLFMSLMGETVITEDEPDGDFAIGPIVDCSARTANILHFDASGQWSNVRRIHFAHLTSLHFRDRYISVISKHLPPRPTDFQVSKPALAQKLRPRNR